MPTPSEHPPVRGQVTIGSRHFDINITDLVLNASAHEVVDFVRRGQVSGSWFLRNPGANAWLANVTPTTRNDPLRAALTAKGPQAELLLSPASPNAMLLRLGAERAGVVIDAILGIQTEEEFRVVFRRRSGQFTVPHVAMLQITSEYDRTFPRRLGQLLIPAVNGLRVFLRRSTTMSTATRCGVLAGLASYVTEAGLALDLARAYREAGIQVSQSAQYEAATDGSTPTVEDLRFLGALRGTGTGTR